MPSPGTKGDLALVDEAANICGIPLRALQREGGTEGRVLLGHQVSDAPETESSPSPCRMSSRWTP